MKPGLGSSNNEVTHDTGNDSYPGSMADLGTAIPVQVIVKFSDSSVADLTLEIPDIITATVSGIRRQIRDTVGGRMINRRLRLIHGGRVLNDSVSLARDVAKISIKGKGVSASAGGFPRRIYLHCSVGDILDATELAKENEMDSSAPVRSTGPELRGFDRLRNAGFSDADISQLRRQFSHLHGDASSGGPGDDQGATGAGVPGTGPIPSAAREEELSRLEEQWINTGVADAGINEGELGGSPLGDDYLEELIGLLVGMFLGIMALFFLKEGGLFSRRQKRSILAGVAINFSFALVRMFN